MFRLPHLARWEQDESRFSEITERNRAGHRDRPYVEGHPTNYCTFSAHSQDPWRSGIAMRNRHPIPLAAVWNDFQHGPLCFWSKDISNVPKHAPAQKCLQLVETVSQCAEASAQRLGIKPGNVG